MAKKRNNNKPPPTNTPPKLPPDPSDLFDSMGDEWTENDWKTVSEAANKFPDEKDRKHLQGYITFFQKDKLSGGKLFKTTYKDTYDALLKTLPITDLESIKKYLEHRIAGKTNNSPITVYWRDTSKHLQKSLFFASQTTITTYKDRIIDIKSVMELLEARVAPFGPDSEGWIPMKLGKDILYVLSGESGSGKTTWALMVCEYGIYLTPKDLLNTHLEVIELFWGGKHDKPFNIDKELPKRSAKRKLVVDALKATLPSINGETAKDNNIRVEKQLKELSKKPYTSSTTTDVARNLRNHLVKHAMTDALRAIVGNDTRTRPKGLSKDLTLLISVVMDEFGPYPAFVRGLCAVQKEVRNTIKDMFPFPVEVKMIVVGTGTDVQPDNIGSHPSTFEALRMPSDRPMKDMIKDVLARNFGDMAKTLVSALDSHVQLQHLICNPRFAACLLKRLLEHCNPVKTLTAGRDALFATEEQALMCLDLLLTGSAIMYKRLNGMNKSSAKDVEETYQRALRLILRNPVNQELIGEDLNLLRTKGVLTDGGMWVPLEEKKKYIAPPPLSPNSAATHVEVMTREFSLDGTPSKFVFVVPRTGRYVMSMAQQLLFRMSYGYQVLETAASWQRYEVVVADYMSMLLYGMQGQKLRGFLQRFEEEATVVTSAKAKAAKKKTAPSANEKPAASAEIKNALQKPLSYSRVVTIHTKKRISPTVAAQTVSKVYDDCNIAASEDTAAVIVNGAGAPYADVIVVVPGVAVILIQCKFYGEGSTINVQEEAKKLEAEIGALNAIAHVPNGAYFRVLATTKDLVPDDLHGFYLLNTRSETSLAPLFTPLHQPVAANGKDSKIARRMGVPEKRQRDGD